MTSPNAPERSIALERSYNIRDVGGYATGDGRRVRWRRLLRSDSLHALTPSSQQTLRGHGLKTIIDLRRPSEAAKKPNVFAAANGLIYRNLPLFDDDVADVVDAPADTLEELYVRYIDMCQPQLRTIVSSVAAASDTPLLVHCAVGKDRTGLVIALTLGALGVERDGIAADYALSHALLAPLFDFVLAGVDDDEVGSASGVLDAMQQMGGATGIAVLGTVFFAVAAARGHVSAFHETLWIEAGVLAVTGILVGLLPRRAREPAHV